MGKATVKLLRPRTCGTLPTVTVVVPCYRYGHYLCQVVATTLSQPGVRVDLVIVDDASPDGSVEVARELAYRHEAVTLIEHSVNLGHIATYNDGIAAATGTYLVLLSADDLLAPGALARATSLMELEPSVAFVYGYSPDFVDDPPTARHWYHSWSVWGGDNWLKQVCAKGRNVVGTPEVVMRRDIMEKIGSYEANLPHTADLLTWLRAAALGDVGRVNGPDQAYYRVHGGNMHLTDYSGALTDLSERCRTFETFIGIDLAGDPRQHRFRELARRGLATESMRWALRTRDLDEDGWEESAQVYADTAKMLWPAVVSTSLWRRYERRPSARLARLDQLLFQADWELRHKLRWRRWRRFGT